MPVKKPMINYMYADKHDEFRTPDEPIKALLQNIKTKHSFGVKVWECTGIN